MPCLLEKLSVRVFLTPNQINIVPQKDNTFSASSQNFSKLISDFSVAHTEMSENTGFLLILNRVL